MYTVVIKLISRLPMRTTSIYGHVLVQYSTLVSSCRLLARHEYPLALAVCSCMRVPASDGRHRVLTHWARHMIDAQPSDGALAAARSPSPALSDEQLAQVIVGRLAARCEPHAARSACTPLEFAQGALAELSVGGQQAASAAPIFADVAEYAIATGHVKLGALLGTVTVPVRLGFTRYGYALGLLVRARVSRGSRCVVSLPIQSRQASTVADQF